MTSKLTFLGTINSEINLQNRSKITLQSTYSPLIYLNCSKIVRFLILRIIIDFEEFRNFLERSVSNFTFPIYSFFYSILYVEEQKLLATNLLADRKFGSAEMFDQTSTVWFGPNDRTFFCRTQNFFLYYTLHFSTWLR